MQQTLKSQGVEGGVRLVACQVTVDLFGWQKDEFIPGIDEGAGAASYLASAKEANATLFV